MDKLAKAHFPKSFGVFSPTGYVVMAFATDENALRAREVLIRNRFDKDEVTHYSHDEVRDELEKSEEHAIDPIQLGQDVSKVEVYLDLAKQGCGFLVVHAPEDREAGRAVKLVKSFGLKFAEKYNRLTLQELA